MNKFIGLCVLLIGCAIPVDVQCPDMSPGTYQFTLNNTGAVSEFCPRAAFGEIDFTNKDTFLASCPADATCDTDFFDNLTTCAERHFNVYGFTAFSCSFSVLNEFELYGNCTDNWGTFVCSYDAFLDKKAPRQ